MTAQHDFPVGGPLQVDLRVRSADATLTAEDVAVATVRLIGPDDLVDRCRVELVGEVLEVEVPQARTSLFAGFGSRVRVEVVVPTGSSVTAKSGSGDLQLSAGWDTLDLRTGSGGLTVASAQRVTASTGSGSSRVERAGTVEVTAGSGDVWVGDAEDVRVRVGSGDITIDRAHRARANTGSGTARIGEAAIARLGSGSGNLQVRRAVGGEIEATAASGNVTVGVPDGVAALLDCQSVSGRVRSELQPTGEPGEGEESVVLRLRTVSGSISVHRA